MNVAGSGSGILARLKQSIFGLTEPTTESAEHRFIGLASNGSFVRTYADRSDDEKIAVIAQVATIKRSSADFYSLANATAKLAGTLKSLDAAGARVILELAARCPPFGGSLDLNQLARLLEHQPAGTLHDPELHRLFRQMKQGCAHFKKLDGLDITRRIEAALGREESAAAPSSPGTCDPAEAGAIDQVVDAWIDAWMQLIAELRATRGQVDATLRERFRQAQQIVANTGALRRLMDPAHREGPFQRLRLPHYNEQLELRTFDHAWLAKLRQSDAAWQKLSDTETWSGSMIPGLATLTDVRAGAEQTLVDFLRTLRGAKPSAKWSQAAKELASGAHGAAIRQAILDWLATLPVPGSGSTRARLWPQVRECRNFRSRVLNDVRRTESTASAALVAFFDYDAPFQIYDDGSGGYGTDEPDPAILSEVAVLLARGAVWMLINWPDAATVAALQRTAETALLRLSSGPRGVNYRSLAVANACILVLGEIATTDAVQALGRIKLKVRDERLAKQIANAMQLAADHAGMTVTDLHELAVPTFELDDVGLKTVGLGEFTAALRVFTTTDVTIAFTRRDGKAAKSVPAAVKSDPDASAALKQLKAAAKSIEEALPVHRQRIESLYLTRRTWPFAIWRERYLDHPLIGTLARRLIWTVTASDETPRSVMWHEGGLVDSAGHRAAEPGDDATVTLWHPLDARDQDVAAWRGFLLQHKLVQPFKQAHRELYPLTDAEREAGNYSNRFAGHILRQHQSVALARLRGWQATMRISADVPNDDPTHLRIPDLDLAAELWTQAAGGDDAEFTANLGYVFISTDRVRFRRCATAAGGRRILGDTVLLETVPARVFSEVMRDVDLFVGVASIGNDPAWRDGGADAQHPSQWRRHAGQAYWDTYATAALAGAAEHRRQFLSELLPSLGLADRCTLDDRYLHVRGRLRSYRIHLGSGNIWMEDDRYLCIVPNSAKEDGSMAYLPFEGDRMLSIILSKAMMLAADDKITDKQILSQLNR